MDDKEKKQALYREVEALVKEEKELRKKFNVGDRYQTITSRLQALLKYVHQAVSLPKQEQALKRASPELSEGEQYVFVHLFNAKGKTLLRWEAVLSPRLLQEYSVNRPIYAAQNQVEAYIRSRSDDDDHAFLMMKVAQADVLPASEATDNRDSLGQLLVKLKEKSLKEQGLIYFFHKGERYIFTNGHLVLNK
jgi:hypothetical protein